MKSILILVIIANVACGQSETTKSLSGKVFKIYKEEADPYLKKFAENRLENDGSKEVIAAIEANYQSFLARIQRSESKVKDVLKKNPQAAKDKNYISKVLEAQYQLEFVGLPKEFWASARKRVSEIE